MTKINDIVKLKRPGKCRGATHNIRDLRYSVPKDKFIVFQNGCNYDYHFIIKRFSKKFEKQFTWLGKNTEKYLAFLVRVERESYKSW